MKRNKLTTTQKAVAALMAAVLCILGPISVPVGVVPVSLTNLVICLAAWLLGARLATLSVAVYLALGLAGLPVFSGYGAGLAKVAGPTGGYLAGYLLLALVGGWAVEKSGGGPLPSGLGLAAGMAADYLLGTVWFAVQMGCAVQTALAACVYPFVLFDAAKLVLACLLGPLLRTRLEQAGLLQTRR